jgi:glycosyltransferase involved in cell wall biosynthesis
VPHGVNPKTFKPLDNISEKIYKSISGGKTYDFILFYNNRNMRRKMTGDVMMSYKMFCDTLPKEDAKKCLLLMHTRAVDEIGTDLITMKKHLCFDYDVKITSDNMIEQYQLNELYNISDCTINIAHSEGFGLSTAESLMAGTPIIVTVTGGLQDQCEIVDPTGVVYDPNDYIRLETLSKYNKFLRYGEWCKPVWPSATNVSGSITTPYIYEDRVNDKDVVAAIKSMYKMTREERKRIGMSGRTWMMKQFSSEIMCGKLMDGIDNTLEIFQPRKKFELYKIV